MSQWLSEKASSFVAKVISEGRITIPSEIREFLKIQAGDYVKCNIRLLRHASEKAENPV